MDVNLYRFMIYLKKELIGTSFRLILNKIKILTAVKIKMEDFRGVPIKPTNNRLLKASQNNRLLKASQNNRLSKASQNNRLSKTSQNNRLSKASQNNLHFNGCTCTRFWATNMQRW